MRRLLEKLRQTTAGEPEERDPQVHLATAVLLAEMSRADFEEQPEESAAIQALLQERFELSAQDSEVLAASGREEADRAVSLHDYTRTLNEELSDSEKLRVIEMLWEVALSAGLLDKHEDYLMRKLAELLYVPHGELIRLKHQVQERMAAE